MKKIIIKIFPLLILSILSLPININAESINGIGIIGYGDIYTANRTISVTSSIVNNNKNIVFYEVYSSTIYLSVIELNSKVTEITLDDDQKDWPFKTSISGNTTVYELDNIPKGIHCISFNTNSTTPTYDGSKNDYIYINVKPDVVVMPELINTPIEKDFKIRFNKPVKDDGNLNNYISILNQYGDKYTTYNSYVSSDDPCCINVHCYNPFRILTDYTLHVLPGIKSTSGSVFSKETVLRFRTTNDMSYYSFNNLK